MENVQPYIINPINNKQTCFFNGAEQSPKSLVDEAIKGEIGFLNLYTYSIQDPVTERDNFAQLNPSKKIINIGTEFLGKGTLFENNFYINYDAYEFTKMIRDGSVEIVNIDFPLYMEQYKQDNLTDKELLFLTESKRILKPNGKINMLLSLIKTDFSFHPKDYNKKKEEIIKQIGKIGFKDLRFLSKNDFLENYRFSFSKQYTNLIPISAIKN